ncbi:MAG TPA: glycosyltransferase [bacterium (Candidatus Stahlbacteria)]|nr:glycosyltransferase [Candidatus Stahlbacteria bacterium]
MSKLAILVPTYSANQDITLGIESIQKQSLKGVEVIQLKQKRHTNVAQMLNDSIKRCKGEYFAILTYGVEMLHETATKVVEELDSHKDYGMVYTDYFEVLPDGEKRIKSLRDYDGDWTERFNFGFLKVYRKKCVEELGGFDPKYNFAYEYDLRLRLEEKYKIGHIGVPLYNYRLAPEEVQVKESAKSKLYAPGEGKYGVFSYLFYSKDEEKEIEHAFKEMLKRRGIYLLHENKEIIYTGKEKYDKLVSVIIPVFNRENFISYAIESVLNQTLEDFELICVDNGSTDKTKDIIRAYMQRDNRVRLIENYLNIIGYSLNLGVKAARGKYIAQLDSDDEYYPRTLELMVKHLETHPKCGLAISYYEVMDANGQTLKEFGIIKHLEYDRNNILRVDGAGAVRVWRKKVIEEFGGFDDKIFGDYGEDYDLVLKVSEKYDIDRVHEVLYRYRRHPDNTDVKRDQELKIRNKNLARQMAAERRKKINQRLGHLKVTN